MRTLLNIAACAAVSSAVLSLLWHMFGPVGLAFGLPILVVFAIPLLDVLAASPRFASRLALRKVAGRYFAYRNVSLDIEIDDGAVCWVSTSDIRKLVPHLPADAVLLRVYAGELQQRGDPRQWRITIAALSQFLAKSTDADNTRFAAWLEKDVARPARNKRERAAALLR